MRTIIFITSILLFSFQSLAQQFPDIIISEKGDTIQCRIKELSSKSIFYVVKKGEGESVTMAMPFPDAKSYTWNGEETRVTKEYMDQKKEAFEQKKVRKPSEHLIMAGNNLIAFMALSTIGTAGAWLSAYGGYYGLAISIGIIGGAAGLICFIATASHLIDAGKRFKENGL